MIRFVALAVIIVVFVWFFSTMREKFQNYKSRHGGPDYPSEGSDPDGSSGPWGGTGRPKKAQQARPKAEVIEIEPLRAAREAQKPGAVEGKAAEGKDQGGEPGQDGSSEQNGSSDQGGEPGQGPEQDSDPGKDGVSEP